MYSRFDDIVSDDLLDLLIDSDSEDTYKDTPKQEYQPVFKPRILKGDIRRSYSNMLANVVNSGNFHLLYGIFDSFVCPSAQQVTTKHTDGNVIQVVRTGILPIVTLWYAIMHMEPDVMVGLENTTVHISSRSNCSKIVSKFRYSGTRVYDLKFSNEESNALPVVTSPESNPFSDVDNPITTVINAMESMKLSLPLLMQPIPCSNEGSIVFYTDDNKFITRIEIETHETMSCL